MSDVIRESPAANYDQSSMRLVLGDAAFQDAIDSGVHPSDIVALAEKLDTIDHQDKVMPDERANVEGWTKQDYISFGKWITSTVPGTPRSRHVDRAYELGLGPEPQRIYRKDRTINEPRFKGFGDFFEQVGAEGAIHRFKYDHMTFGDVMKYIRTNADRLASAGRRPTVVAFEELAKSGKGPSQEVAKRITNQSMGKLIDMAGYPVYENWTDDDYVEWGVEFMIVNDRVPYYGALRFLSSKFRGPSDRGISNRFGGIIAFQNVVLEAYDQRMKREQRVLSRKLDDIQIDTENGLLPDGLIVEGDIPATLAKTGRARLVFKFLPDLPPHKASELINMKSPDAFVKSLCRKAEKVTQAHVETVALALGIFDDIWPPETNSEHLRLANYDDFKPVKNKS